MSGLPSPAPVGPRPKRRAGRLVTALAVLAGATLLATALNGVPSASAASGAVGGSVDASGRGASLLPLAGEWELAGGEAGRYAVLPGLWKEPRGHEVYRLRVEGLDPEKRYALKLPAIDTSFRLFADGALIASGGKPAPTAADCVPGYAPGLAKLPRGIGSVELRLEIANFVGSRGGLARAILLGQEDAAARAELVARLSTELASGLLFMLGVLFAFAALLKRAGRHLAMGLAYFSGALAIFFISPEVPAWRAFPGLGWELLERIAFASSVAFPFLLFAASHAYFGGLGRKAFALLAGLVALLSAILLGLPATALNGLIPLAEVYILALVVGALVLCARAIRRGYAHAWLIGFGFAALVAQTMSAILLLDFKVDAAPFLPLSFLHAFVESSSPASALVDILSFAVVMVAFNAFGVLLFADSVRREPSAAETENRRAAVAARCAELGISARETEAVLLALAGKRNREIAAALGISENTAKLHLSSAYAKAGLKSRAELFAFFG